MKDADVLELLQKVGAFRSGHFVFTSGLHADTYVNKDALYPFTAETSRLCREIAERFNDAHIEAVIGPATAAAVLSQWTAHHLSELTGRTILSLYADKDGAGGFVVRRGYNELAKGKRVLIVEDLTTTGGSIRKVIGAARIAGAYVAGAIALCNRGGVTKSMVGDPDVFDQLLNVHLEQWPAQECELCKRAIPVNTDVGHGRQFLESTGAAIESKRN